VGHGTCQNQGYTPTIRAAEVTVLSSLTLRAFQNFPHPVLIFLPCRADPSGTGSPGDGVLSPAPPRPAILLSPPSASSKQTSALTLSLPLGCHRVADKAALPPWDYHRSLLDLNAEFLILSALILSA
jgi:hypothetical protein